MSSKIQEYVIEPTPATLKESKEILNINVGKSKYKVLIHFHYCPEKQNEYIYTKEDNELNYAAIREAHYNAHPDIVTMDEINAIVELYGYKAINKFLGYEDNDLYIHLLQCGTPANLKVGRKLKKLLNPNYALKYLKVNSRR